MATVNISAGDKTAHDAEVTQVGPNAYRLEEELGLFTAAEDEQDAERFPRFGDTIEASTAQDGSLVFVRVLERGSYRHFDTTVSQAFAESKSLALLLEEVIAEGGHWQRIMGGFLFVALPERSPMDFPARLDSIASEA